MKFRSCFLLLILLMVASAPGCKPKPQPSATQASATSPAAAVSVVASTTRTLPEVVPMVTKAPDAELPAKVFLNAWKADDYQTMYSLLTPASQDALPQDKFTQRYKDTAVAMTLQKLDYEILSKMTNPSSAQVAYRVNFHTQMLGDLTREMTMNLSMEKGAWRVQWDDGLILPELHGGNTLALDLKSPTRGNIYDQSGNAVAVANTIYALGIVKGEANADNEGLLLSELSKLTGKPPESIKALYDRDSVYQGDYVPVGEAARDAVLARYDVLSSLYQAGLRMTEYDGRFYSDGGIAPHVTGYVAPIPAERKDQYLREGFRLDDRVGMTGLERWGESYLLGQRGAKLYVTDPQGSTVTLLKQVDSKPSQSIYMTIDSDLQLQAQQAIAGFNGAVVVMERDTGRVLAMVSSPGFDPNAFEYQNYNSNSLLGMITGDSLNRLYNRAAGNGYPLGSVFKIITMSAALESGLFTPESTLDCQWDWTEIPGLTLSDWTKDKGFDPSGKLTLPEGLMRSCNPWFYHIGLTLYQQGHEKDISNMARAFGLGSATGIGQVAEDSGNIPDPVDDQSAALIAIGQDKVLVNPLQVARFVAAVGNGGTLYRPQVVEKITDPDGKASFTFKPDVQGKLPVKPENLKVVQQAMGWVVQSPRGTAVRAFSGLNIPVYGKTGTAQNDFPGHPHAWFAGYTATGNPNKPDIAFAVIAEYAGEGSDIAAPIARRVLEAYYLGHPQRVYPWESRINVTRTPTPIGGGTPGPADATPAP